MERPTNRSSEPMGISKHFTPQEHALSIRKLLMILAEARQAAVSQQAFEVYSTQLQAYDLVDLKAAITKLSLTRRESGETAFPDLGTVDEAARYERKRRWAIESEAREVIREAEQERHRREHPEEYVQMSEIVGDFFKKHAMDAAIYPSEAEDTETNPLDRMMAALSQGLAAGKEYEEGLTQQIMAWRQDKGL